MGRASYSAPMTLQLSHQGTTPVDPSTDSGRNLALLRDSKIDQFTGAIGIALTAPLTQGGSVCTMPLYLSPAHQDIGSITFGPCKNDIPIHSLEYSDFFKVDPSFNGRTRGMACFREGAILHVTAFVLDDEDSANTQTAVDHDMQFFRELKLDIRNQIVGFDAYRGRIITHSIGTFTMFDFV
ncbi:hypothetical protein BJ138DRAFT_1154133 [Hygrophoropsis aurantiaca]|uniref:Uncharacterized protein n=1 Tax=Hygrophoropsis aurantiaca TaxID=72124 RepID=A0ACB8AA45_9AGAM|nr:hypothetical protein BJ138DRAFT_1154133 [Hygrophoropsis aurantiaca]